MSYEGPLRRRRDMQKTLMIVASQLPDTGLIYKTKQANESIKPLPPELLEKESPDPAYMDRPRNPNWRGTHD